uniref:Monocarboxylate transporter 14 n=1 Tax=Ceratitis capitata TaxID=7213 RepID=W8AKZ3_CERCA
MVANQTNTKAKPDGAAYQNLSTPTEIESIAASMSPTPTTTPLNKSIKHDFFPEVKFCDLSASDLNDGDGDGDYAASERLIKHCLITVDDGNGGMTSTINPTTTFALMEGNDVKKRTRLISNESGDSIDSGSTDKKKPEIPDGGYGWVVVMSSLVVSLIADGLSFSFGLINSQLLDYFGESPSKTAWISSLFFSVPLLMGPIWSNLVDNYGCRKMTIFGGLLSAIGFGLSSFCNSVEMLMLTFGVISGLGLGIGYVTAVVSIAFWFDKKRTFATGIGASGTGIGTFLYAPLTQWLIDTYGWRGATLILAGTMLNTCVCGALMRDPDWLIEENRLESRSQSVTTFSNSSVCLEEIKKLLDTGITKEAVLDTLVTKNNTEANQQIDDPHEHVMKRYRSEIFLPTYLGSQDLECPYEIKSRSRRSLRHKEGMEAPSRENLLSMSSTGPNPTATIIGSPDDTMMGGIAETAAEEAKKSFLASMETLSPSEKNSFDRATPSCGSMSSQHDFGGVHSNVLPPTPRLYQRNTSNEGNIANSRYSLNENFFSAKNAYATFGDLKPNGLRHNSVDILSDETYYMSIKNDTTGLLDGNFRKHHNDPTIVTIPENEAAAATKSSRRARADSISGMRRLSKSKKPVGVRPSLRYNTSIKNSNFLKNMRIHRNSIHYRGAMLNTHRYRLRASSCPNIYRNSMTTIAKEEEDTWYETVIDTMKTVFDFSMFMDLKFTLFNLSTLFLFIWFIIPYLYLPEHMKLHGYETSDSAQMISAIGIAQTIGMIGLGYVGDRPWMNVNICYSVCMWVCGISVFLMPFLVLNYALLVLVCITFGFTFASSYSFTPSICVSIVDLDDFTCAYGLVLLVQGIGMILGPPIAGEIYEITLRWDGSFYFAGVFIVLSGVASYMVEVCKKRERDSNSTVSETKKAKLVH